ncbi:hypothetical protein BHM03_00054559 [Ensete ventricosum]|nr:hypothetical protein BHM03_00054559 [Ensete ventricosum]
MSDLVARTGRHQQRYEAGCRLVSGSLPHLPPSRVSSNITDRKYLIFYNTSWCIPFRYRNCDDTSDAKPDPDKEVEVLMINSPSGPGLLFPKELYIVLRLLSLFLHREDGKMMKQLKRQLYEKLWKKQEFVGISWYSFLGDYIFKSKTLQDEFSPEGLCKAAVFAMHVREELELWPEQSTRHRTWVTIPEAAEQCRHPWMRDALLDGFLKWHASIMASPEEDVTPEG